jgi:magnesium-protoporphyrin O-methyltransferase
VSSCYCDDYGATADEQFTSQRAASDLVDYQTKGPDATTRLLRDSLAASGATSGSLLDIGAGIGVLTFELLARGVAQATGIDASAAFVEAASREARRRGCVESAHFIHDDFLHIANQTPPATIVTLDRVICCYPRYETLLMEALRHATRYLALSYPRDLFYVRAGNALSNARRHFGGRQFRTYVHPAADMETMIISAGFTRAARRRTLAWCVDVYERRSATL